MGRVFTTLVDKPRKDNLASQTAQRNNSREPQPYDVLELQRAIGNQAVQRLIQAKLKIGQPNDKYEQEADRVADKVMRMPDPEIAEMKSTSDRPAISQIQRECTDCEDEELHRQPVEEKESEELAQAKPLSKQITPVVQHQTEFDEEQKDKDELMLTKLLSTQFHQMILKQDRNVNKRVNGNILPKTRSKTSMLEIQLVQRDMESKGKSLTNDGCVKKLGTCDFYSCLSALTTGDKENGYYWNYGLKYCERFGKSSLNKDPKAARWIDCVTLNLQRGILSKCIKYGNNLNKIKECAYGTHAKVYTDCGICELDKKLIKQIRIALIPDVKDIWTAEGRKQILEALAQCFFRPFYFEAIINRFEVLGNLDEEKLGQYLAILAKQSPDLNYEIILGVMELLSNTLDDDDVALYFMKSLSKEELDILSQTAHGRWILFIMKSAMESGWTAKDEKEQIKRIGTRCSRLLIQRAHQNTSNLNINYEMRLRSFQNSGQQLPKCVRNFFESRFGCEFSQVRIHTDTSAADTAHSLNAKAFTIGRDVVFGSGQYAPNTATGRQLLAHELTHVVQQSPGHSNSKVSHHCLAGTIQAVFSTDIDAFQRKVRKALALLEQSQSEYTLSLEIIPILRDLVSNMATREADGTMHGQGTYTYTLPGTAPRNFTLRLILDDNPLPVLSGQHSAGTIRLYIRKLHDGSVADVASALYHEAVHLLIWFYDQLGPRYFSRTRARSAIDLNRYRTSITLVRRYLNAIIPVINTDRQRRNVAAVTTNDLQRYARALINEMVTRAETYVWDQILYVKEGKKGPATTEKEIIGRGKDIASTYLFESGTMLTQEDHLALGNAEQRELRSLEDILGDLARAHAAARWHSSLIRRRIPRTKPQLGSIGRLQPPDFVGQIPGTVSHPPF